MKISKTAVLAMGCVFTAAGLGLTVATAVAGNDNEKTLNVDLKNAVQHIEEVIFISSGSSNSPEAIAQQVGDRLVGIKTNRFVLSEDENSNTITPQGNGKGDGSSILGGKSNKMKGGAYNVILAGSGNEMNLGIYNTILGGEGNKTDGSTTSTQRSTIIGGKDNTIEGNHSVTVGGHNNSIKGNQSTIVGNNSSVTGNNSTALGLNSKINASGSFLWTDGEEGYGELAADNVFAVMSRSGMVINTKKAHPLAQLTIGNPMIVYESNKSKDIECGGNQGGGIMKVVKNGETSQVCFCSCDGSGWNSLFGGRGACQNYCQGTTHEPPKCGGFVQYKASTNDKKRFSGSCEVGEVLEGTGAYLVTSDGKIHWSCQTEDGSVTPCSGQIGSEENSWQPYQYHCIGEFENANLVNGIGNNPDNNVDSILCETQNEADGKECSYVCKNGYKKEGNECVKDEYGTPGVCTGGEVPVDGEGVQTSSEVPEVDKEWEYVENKSELEACQWTCNDGYQKSGNGCVNTQQQDCTGKPDNSYWVNGKFNQTWNGSAWAPATKDATYSSNSSVECSFQCNTNYTWNATTKTCVENAQITQQQDCTGKPDNSYWVNGKFNQTWNGSAWAPATKDATYSSNSSVECSFQCNTNYTWNATTKTCVENAQITQQQDCTGKPDNSYWVNGKFNQTWNGSVWTPATKDATYSSNSSVECSFQCNTNYTWNATTKTCVANGHLGNCTGLPAYAEWVNGKFNQTWNGSAWAPATKDATYNTDGSVECSFKCKTNYTWNATSKMCVENAQQQDCTGKPDNSYWVNGKFNQTWNGSAWTPATKDATYSSNSSVECSFQCNTNYTWNATTKTCVADGHLGDCTGLPAYAEWVNGKFKQTWNGSAWTPATKDATYSTDGSVECSFKCKTNYTWKNNKCEPNTQTANCGGSIPSGAEKKSGHGTYTQTWNGSAWTPTKSWSYNASECGYLCKTNYTWKNNKCEPNTQTANCGGSIPSGAEKKSGHGTYTQTWNGSAWTPTKSWSYNASECGYLCKTNYTWKNNKCEPNTQTINCGGSIPSGAEKKSGHGTYTQTWNGSAWTPTKSWSYNASECGYLCKTNYTWKNNKCEPNTQTVNCGGSIPSGAEKKSGHGTYTQTWNGSAWIPTKSWSYNASECGYLCNINYTWNSATSKCVEKQCGTTGLPSSMNGVLTGKSTYVGTDNNRNWQYNTSLGACQWKCAETYILNDAGNGCRKIENATCGTLGYTCGEQTSYVKESNKFDTTNSTERIWKCTSKDGIDSNTCTYSCPSGQKLEWTSTHSGTCVENDSCADYPLTSCNFPGAVYCSKCPSDSSKMKLEVCAPTYDSFAPHYDERGVTYWIKTDGTCPVGAICAPANVTWYTKKDNTCVPDEHNNKIIGCKPCYRKGNMSPSCVFDVNYCSKSCYPSLNNGGVCENAYGHNNWQNTCLAQTTEDDCKKLGAMNTNDNGTISFYRVTLPYLYGNAVACCEWAYHGG